MWLFKFFSPSAWSMAGLAVNLVGVFLLFRFGIPYYVRTGGEISIIIEQIDHQQAAKENRAAFVGWFGLVLVCLGTIMQMIGSYIG
jgi:hypothetical protein